MDFVADEASEASSDAGSEEELNSDGELLPHAEKKFKKKKKHKRALDSEDEEEGVLHWTRSACLLCINQT